MEKAATCPNTSSRDKELLCVLLPWKLGARNSDFMLTITDQLLYQRSLPSLGGLPPTEDDGFSVEIAAVLAFQWCIVSSLLGLREEHLHLYKIIFSFDHHGDEKSFCVLCSHPYAERLDVRSPNTGIRTGMASCPTAIQRLSLLVRTSCNHQHGQSKGSFHPAAELGNSKPRFSSHNSNRLVAMIYTPH